MAAVAPLCGLQSADALPIQSLRKGGRVVEGSGLENRQGCKPLVGSNPTPSANLLPWRVRRELELLAMKFGKIRTGALGALFVIAGLGLAAFMPDAAQSGGHRGTPEEQAACTPDVFRLCFSSIPREQEIVACLIRNRAQLSPGCGRVFAVKPRNARTVARARPHHATTVARIKAKPKSKQIIKKPRPAKPTTPTPQPIPMRT